MRNYLFVLAFLFISHAAHSQTAKPHIFEGKKIWKGLEEIESEATLERKSVATFYTAHQRFWSKDITQRYWVYKKKPTARNRADFLRMAMEYAAEQKREEKIYVSTWDEKSNKETKGATVLYEPIYMREMKNPPAPKSFPKRTNFEDRIPIGYYYIWAERDEKPRSSKNRMIAIENVTASGTCIELNEWASKGE